MDFSEIILSNFEHKMYCEERRLVIKSNIV
jgi:hypothetical protein